jgi:Baseplate J-like protein
MGSWTTVVVSVQPAWGGEADADLLAGVRGALEPLRPAGHDVTVRGPRWAPLEVLLEVRVDPARAARAVQAALEAALGDGVAADGTPAFFHPDQFGFGDPVYLSPLLAAAMAVPGVRDVRALRFRRAGPAGGARVHDPVRVAADEIPLASAAPGGAAWRGTLAFRLLGGR